MAPRGSPPCPSPSPCRCPAPTGSSLQRQPAQGAPITRHSLLPHTSLPPLHLPLTPTRHLCPLFGYAPNASLRLPCPSPHLPAPTPCTLCSSRGPSVHRSSLSLPPPSQTLRDPFSLPSPPSTFPSSFSSYPSPPSRAPPSPNGSSPRYPLQAPLTCAATPVPALVRLLQLEGDRGPERLQPSPGGAGGGWRRAAPPEPPGPSAPRPPGTSASAARCGPCHRPPDRLPASAPQRAPHSPPTPAAAAYLLCGAETGPLSPELSLAYRAPDPASQPIRGLFFPLQRMIGLYA